jgi:uncharacterized protein
MANPRQLPGKFVWFEHVSSDARKAQAFYAEVLGWKVQSFPVGGEDSYDMIYVDDTMIGGYVKAKDERAPGYWISCVSVEDVDRAAKAAAAEGGRVIEPPAAFPGAGRIARIADPQGAEIYLFKKEGGDPPDGESLDRRPFWNELHTPDPVAALRFYEKVVGFSHRALEMAPDSTYYILSHGGVDRGGATHRLSPGAAPHWLPYIEVEDPDVVIERARAHGATIRMDATDIPGVGRFGVIVDPTGASLAVMKADPRQS